MGYCPLNSLRNLKVLINFNGWCSSFIEGSDYQWYKLKADLYHLLEQLVLHPLEGHPYVLYQTCHILILKLALLSLTFHRPQNLTMNVYICQDILAYTAVLCLIELGHFIILIRIILQLQLPSHSDKQVYSM